MRGELQNQSGLFSYLSLESRVPLDHPLRKIRELVRAVLVDMDSDFAALDSSEGRPSIPPGAVAFGVAFAGVLRRPIGTAADGATGLQPSVPLVCGLISGCAGIGGDDIYQEP